MRTPYSSVLHIDAAASLVQKDTIIDLLTARSTLGLWLHMSEICGCPVTLIIAALGSFNGAVGKL